MKVLLLINDYYYGSAVIRNFAERGTQIYIISFLGRTTLKYSRFVKQYKHIKLPHDRTGYKMFSRLLDQYCVQNDINIVIPSNTTTFELLSRICKLVKHVNLFPVCTFHTYKQLNNKWKFWKLCTKIGVLTPKTIYIKHLNEIYDNYLMRLSFPIIAKPLNRSSSIGIVKFEKMEEAIRFFSAPKEVVHHPPIILQEFICGEHTGLNIFSDNGHIEEWTMQREPDGQQTIFFHDETMLEAGKEIANFTHYTGVANFDFIKDDKTGKPYILECNTRFWYRTWASWVIGAEFVNIGIHRPYLSNKFQHYQYASAQVFPAHQVYNIFLLFHRQTGYVRWRNIVWIYRIIRDPLPLLIKFIQKVQRKFGISKNKWTAKNGIQSSV